MIEINYEINNFITFISITSLTLFSTAYFTLDYCSSLFIIFGIIHRLFEGSMGVLARSWRQIGSLFAGFVNMLTLYFGLGWFVFVSFHYIFIQFFLHFKWETI